MTACPFCATPAIPKERRREGTLQFCYECARWYGPSDVAEQRDRARHVAMDSTEEAAAWKAVADQLAEALADVIDAAVDANGALTAYKAILDSLRGQVAG